MSTKKFTTASFASAKKNKEKITMLTAYDYTTAKMIDQAGIDCILVGDSLGMVILGYEDTLQVTVEDIIHHCRPVARAAARSMVIADMPFMSYHVSVEESVRNAGKMIQLGLAQAVKLEGGANVIDKVRAIINAQIPVMGHLGLTPQSINTFGGYKVQGKEENQAKKILDEALLLQEAGAFAIVLECVPEKLAKLISEKLDIPTIGIGAGKYCDGQVLVVQDMLGMYEDITPKFVKQYTQLNGVMKQAFSDYIKDVKEMNFPKEEHTFAIDDGIIKKLY